MRWEGKERGFQNDGTTMTSDIPSLLSFRKGKREKKIHRGERPRMGKQRKGKSKPQTVLLIRFVE